MKALRLIGLGMLTLMLVMPAALAQSVIGNPWIYFTVNTVILWIIAFLLVSVLPLNMNDNEKKLMHLAGFAFAAIVSWTMVGGAGFIWQVGVFATIFNVRFIVNWALLGAIFYFLVNYFMGGEGKGKVGIGLLVALTAAVIAAKMPYYLWQAGTGRELIELAFGERGIFTVGENRIFIFISLSVLFTWLLNAVGVKLSSEGADQNKVNMLLAVIVAANVAHAEDPISIGTVIVIGEFIIGFSFFQGMRQNMGGWGAFFMSAFLVHLIASLVFKEKAALGGAPFTGMSVLAGAGLAVGAILLSAIGGFVYTQVKGRERGGSLATLSRILGNRLKNWLRGTSASGAMNDLKIKDKEAANEYIVSLKEMRLETYALWNYILRHQIYEAKKKEVERSADEVGKKEKELGIQDIPNEEVLSEELKELMGMGRSQNPALELSGLASHGPILKEIGERLSDLLTSDGLNTEKREVDAYSKLILESLSGNIKEYERKKEEYGKLKKKFSAIRTIEVYRPLILDSYHLHGVYTRGYGFTLKDSPSRRVIPEVCEVGLQKEGAHFSIDFSSAKKIGYGNPASNHLEVDNRGYCIDDINAIIMGQPSAVGINHVRRFKKKDIIYVNEKERRFNQILPYVIKDWECFLHDMESAAYHPDSRAVKSYLDLINEGKARSPSGDFPRKSENETGFDREALNDPGMFVYWGRKTYNDANGSTINEGSNVNPYPALSMGGLSQYISTLALKKTGDEPRTQNYLRKFVRAGYDAEKKTEGGASQTAEAGAQGGSG